MTGSASDMRARLSHAGRGVAQVFSAEKAFETGPLSDPRLHRFGLHPFRIATSELCLAGRRVAQGLASPAAALDPALRTLLRDGVTVVPDFFPPERFARLREEVRAHVEQVRARHPMPENNRKRGFGKKQPFEGGFDRFDGSTLNRFVHIDPARLPETAAALQDRRLVRLCSLASGFRHAPERFEIYQTRQGRADNRDIQQDVHRDTFHSTIKLWLFLDDVPLEAGPFCYAPGSHRMTLARYRWEYARANRAVAPNTKHRGGSFRLSAADQRAIGIEPLRPYPVAANTLVMADVRGVHCRGPGQAGRERLSLYASLRKWPFAPIPI